MDTRGSVRFVAPARVMGRGVFVATALVCCSAGAAPMSYQGFTVTNVSFAGKFLQNAEVTITFTGNSDDIGTFNFSSNTIVPGCKQPNAGDYCGLVKGVTQVHIAVDGASYDATVAPGQVFVALDSFNGGAGFSSFIGPNGFEPTYPLGLDAGTVNLQDLATPANVSGKAYTCIGFTPHSNYTCADPTLYPLMTNRGPLAIYQAYYMYNPGTGLIEWHYDGASLNAGVFSIRKAATRD
jgi:hypothetical protein